MPASVSALASRRELPVPWRPSDADPEALILERCAAQIVAAAGAGAVVDAVGAARQAELLDAAIAALPASRSECDAAARRIVYLPRTVADGLAADALLGLLQRAAALHGESALLVVAIATSGHEIARLNRLARVAGWELSQLWTDGLARHALHVLERPDSRRELIVPT